MVKIKKKKKKKKKKAGLVLQEGSPVYSLILF